MAVPVPVPTALTSILSPTAYVTLDVPATTFQSVVPRVLIVYVLPTTKSSASTIELYVPVSL